MFNPVSVNGQFWNVIPVNHASERLIDRTGELRQATTDPATRTIYVAGDVVPPLLDKVILHEIAHAISVSYGLLEPLRVRIPENLWVTVEEWSAEFMERHALEATTLAAHVLGRPLCIHGLCNQTV